MTKPKHRLSVPERLRNDFIGKYDCPDGIVDEAADLIDELVTALGPIDKQHLKVYGKHSFLSDQSTVLIQLTMRDLRKVHTALAKAKGETDDKT